MAFLAHGGIIEAAPPVLKSEIKSLSISFQIFPNGVVDPYCSYDNHSFQNFVSCLHSINLVFDDSISIKNRIRYYQSHECIIRFHETEENVWLFHYQFDHVRQRILGHWIPMLSELGN